MRIKLKKFFTRFSTSERQKRARDRINEQVLACGKLETRIQALRGKAQQLVPRETWVSDEEYNSWKRNAGQLIEELFGRKSVETKGWETLWNAAPPPSAFDQDPEDLYLNRISQVRAYLESLKTSPGLSRNAIELVRDRLARHPVLGVSMAIIGILAVLLGFGRGIEWVLSLVHRLVGSSISGV